MELEISNKIGEHQIGYTWRLKIAEWCVDRAAERSLSQCGRTPSQVSRLHVHGGLARPCFLRSLAHLKASRTDLKYRRCPVDV